MNLLSCGENRRRLLGIRFREKIIAIIIVVLTIGSVLFLTQYKSYRFVTGASVRAPTSGSLSTDFPFTIEGPVVKPWKLQINIQTEQRYYSDVHVSLLTWQEVPLWNNTLTKGTYKYEFLDEGIFKIRVDISGYDPDLEIDFRIIAWKPYLEW